MQAKHSPAITAFGTPIGRRRLDGHEDLNSALRDLILRKERSDPGIVVSNVGGWHSKQDLFEWPDEAATSLRQKVCQLALEMTEQVSLPNVKRAAVIAADEAWANVSRDGHYNGLHVHPDRHWSGVYYVTTGDRLPDIPMNGQLELHDPRPAMRMKPLPGSMLGRRLLIDPVPGDVVCFPSWLPHSVHPFRGSGERISIAFNVSIRRAASV